MQMPVINFTVYSTVKFMKNNTRYSDFCKNISLINEIIFTCASLLLFIYFILFCISAAQCKNELEF